MLLFLWDLGTGAQQFDLAELLPRGKVWWVCLLLLSGYYVAFGITLNPEKIPGPGSQAVIWGMYILFGGLMWLIVRRSPPEPFVPGDNEVMWESRQTAKRWLPFALIFTVSSTLSGLLLSWAGQLILVVVWFLGILLGLFLLGAAIKQAVFLKE